MDSQLAASAPNAAEPPPAVAAASGAAAENADGMPVRSSKRPLRLFTLANRGGASKRPRVSTQATAHQSTVTQPTPSGSADAAVAAAPVHPYRQGRQAFHPLRPGWAAPLHPSQPAAAAATTAQSGSSAAATTAPSGSSAAATTAPSGSSAGPAAPAPSVDGAPAASDVRTFPPAPPTLLTVRSLLVAHVPTTDLQRRSSPPPPPNALGGLAEPAAPAPVLRRPIPHTTPTGLRLFVVRPTDAAALAWRSRPRSSPVVAERSRRCATPTAVAASSSPSRSALPIVALTIGGVPPLRSLAAGSTCKPAPTRADVQGVRIFKITKRKHEGERPDTPARRQSSQSSSSSAAAAAFASSHPSPSSHSTSLPSRSPTPPTRLEYVNSPPEKIEPSVATQRSPSSVATQRSPSSVATQRSPSSVATPNTPNAIVVATPSHLAPSTVEAAVRVATHGQSAGFAVPTTMALRLVRAAAAAATSPRSAAAQGRQVRSVPPAAAASDQPLLKKRMTIMTTTPCRPSARKRTAVAAFDTATTNVPSAPPTAKAETLAATAAAKPATPTATAAAKPATPTATAKPATPTATPHIPGGSPATSSPSTKGKSAAAAHSTAKSATTATAPKRGPAAKTVGHKRKASLVSEVKSPTLAGAPAQAKRAPQGKPLAGAGAGKRSGRPGAAAGAAAAGAAAPAAASAGTVAGTVAARKGVAPLILSDRTPEERRRAELAAELGQLDALMRSSALERRVNVHRRAELVRALEAAATAALHAQARASCDAAAAATPNLPSRAPTAPTGRPKEGMEGRAALREGVEGRAALRESAEGRAALCEGGDGRTALRGRAKAKATAPTAAGAATAEEERQLAERLLQTRDADHCAYCSTLMRVLYKDGQSVCYVCARADDYRPNVHAGTPAGEENDAYGAANAGSRGGGGGGGGGAGGSGGGGGGGSGGAGGGSGSLAERANNFKRKLVQFTSRAPPITSELIAQVCHNLDFTRLRAGSVVRHTPVELILKQMGRSVEEQMCSIRIANIINGHPTAIFNEDEVGLLVDLYMQMQPVYMRLKAPKRQNGLNNVYLLHHFCRLCGWHDRAETFPLFKERKIIEEADADFGKVCRALVWEPPRSV